MNRGSEVREINNNSATEAGECGSLAQADFMISWQSTESFGPKAVATYGRNSLFLLPQANVQELLGAYA